MSLQVKQIKGIDYLYFSYYDRNTKKRKFVSCGPVSDPESKQKARRAEKAWLEGQGNDLLSDFEIIQDRLKMFDTGKARPSKKKTATPKPQSFDAHKLAKRLRMEIPVMHYKSSENMAEVRDDSVQLVVTSPPYNVGKGYADHNDNMAFKEYLDLLNSVWKECVRVLCKGGRIAVNIADTWRTPYIPLHSFITKQMLDLGLLMRGIIYWDKGISVGTSTAWGSWRSASNPTLRDVGEHIVIFSKDDFKLHSKNKISTITSAEFTQYTKSVWSFPTVSAKRENHPAPFPDELPARLIKLYSYLGDTVLDPFMGSGTTAKMAMVLGRKAIGYEIDESYRPLIEKKTCGISDVSIPLDSFFTNGTKPQDLETLYPSSRARTSPTNTSI